MPKLFVTRRDGSERAVEADANHSVMSSDHRRPNSRLACQIPFSDALDGLRVTIALED
jgi:2Fe-2S ferredoxin